MSGFYRPGGMKKSKPGIVGARGAGSVSSREICGLLCAGRVEQQVVGGGIECAISRPISTGVRLGATTHADIRIKNLYFQFAQTRRHFDEIVIGSVETAARDRVIVGTVLLGRGFSL